MTSENVEILIIGAGFSGLYAASLLAQQQRPFLVLEARDRLGGRILGAPETGLVSDLGPSWYWPAIHPLLARLIRDLELNGYLQYVTGQGRFQGYDGRIRTVRSYASEPLSWRLGGGMPALIERLAEKLPPGSIRLNHPVCALEQDANAVRVQIGVLEEEPRACFLARQVILALPPRLAAASLLFTPELSPQLTQAMLKTGTWMAGQAKFCALYENPFWRNAGFSGQAFSQLGPMAELHDASAPAGPPYGLIGFVGLPAVQRHNPEALQEAIKSQLALLYGADAARPLRVYYQDWAREPFTATSLDQPPMYEHPLYRPPAGQSSFWNNLVHFAGTETAARHGGYLEGALEAAARAVADLKPGT